MTPDIEPALPGTDSLSRYTLLLVDDTPTNLGVLSNYLKQFGFKTVVARDGESGIKRARYVRPDIILLDVMMPPGIDGFETCRQLKADDSTKDIPVIFMTALAGTEDKVRGFAVGAVDYVTKPLQQEEVMARVTTHLKIRDLTRSLQARNQFLESGHLVGQRVTSILDLEQLLMTVVELIQARFGFYFVGIWLATPAQTLELQAASGADPNQQLPLGQTLALDTPHLLTQVAQTQQAAFVADVKTDPRRLAFAALPATRGELALPLRFGNELLGVLDIHSEQPNAFEPDTQTALETMATQIAIAIRNARQYQLAEKRARELAELNASKDKFFAVIAHDLRSPFNPLLGLSLLLARATDDTPMDDMRDMAQRVYNSARNAYGLLENLLQWSRLQLGRMEYAPEVVDLHKAAARNTRLLGEVAETKGIELENTISAGTTVYADENLLNTVIRNLISNALKFTPRTGRITLWAMPPQNAPDKFVEIWVQDTGVGISPENLARLFRLDKPYSTIGTAEEQGTGLGLLLCQEMAVKNGGRLWIESEVGQGTIVKFTVPRHAPPAV